MKTTKEGFLMNTLRRIPRHMVKALAAGAVLIAAALPLAVASTAGAATVPIVNFVTNANSFAGMVTGTSSVSISGATTLVVTSAVATNLAGYGLEDTTGGAGFLATVTSDVVTGAGPYTHTLVISTSNFATGADAIEAFPPLTLGAGGSPAGTQTILILGSNFAHDGSTVTMTSSDPDVVFAGLTEPNATNGLGIIAGNYAGGAIVTIGATTTGPVNVTLSDSNGTSASLAGAFTISADPAPTALTISPGAQTAVANGQTVLAGTATVTGSGFESGATVSLVSTVDGTSILTAAATTFTNSTTLVITGPFTVQNVVTSGAATIGTYKVTVTNPDHGSGSSAGVLTVSGSSLDSVSPGQIPALASATPTVNVYGAGFQPGFTLTLTGGAGCTAAGTLVPASAVLLSPSQISFQVATTGTTGLCGVQVVNTGGNGLTLAKAGILGIGVVSNNTATISAVALSPSAAIVPGTSGSTPVTMTVTGTGFGPFSTVQALIGTGATVDAAVVNACLASASGTTLTCSVAVNTGSTAGLDGLQVTNGTAVSLPFESALTIAGPVIVSTSPASIATGAPTGTVLTFTGTGFSPTATATLAGAFTNGVFAVTSPTTATLALTSPAILGTGTIQMTQTVSTGITVKSALYTYIIGTAPSVTSLVNANTSIDAVGAGAISVPITITGLGFVTGATVGTFVSAYGKADAVTATVTSVTATTIKATVTIPAGDANLSDGYTVTNPNGGFVKVAAFTLGAALNITAGPTITSVTPTAVTASSTATYTLAGTGFETGAKVTSTSTNATCGTATLTASISLSVSCTVGLITSGISLVVTNPDGGSATIALTPPAVVAPAGLFSKGTVGYAVAGRTETILIKGGGFYGQPKLHSNAKGVVRAVVAADSGALMAARITVAKNGATGWHTITITLANGKSCKVNYLTKK